MIRSKFLNNLIINLANMDNNKQKVVFGIDLSLDELPENRYGQLIKWSDIHKTLGFSSSKSDPFEWGRSEELYDTPENTHKNIKKLKEKFGPILIIQIKNQSTFQVWQHVQCIGCGTMCDFHIFIETNCYLEGFCSNSCYNTNRTCSKEWTDHDCSTCVDQKCNAQRRCHCRICGNVLKFEPLCSTRSTIPKMRIYDKLLKGSLTQCSCLPSHAFKSGNGEKCTYTPSGMTQCNRDINEHPGIHNDYWCPCYFRKHCRVCGGDL